MIFWIALLICSTGIAGLFFLNRDNSVRNSRALWLPVIWLWIIGSRPVSAWLGIGGGSGLASTLDGSPADAAFFALLMIAGILVLFFRRDRTIALLKTSGPILIFFFYCLISVMWSPFPEPAFKRWTKAIGDLVMVLILMTDPQPIAALRRFFSRVGFVLLPASIFMIRYTELGRNYTPDGVPENTGVTMNKNSLGLIVFLVSLAALWNVRALLIDNGTPNRGRRLVAQVTLLTFGIVLLQMAHSATAVACFILGGAFMLIATRRAIRTRPGRVYALSLVIVIAGGLGVLFGGGSAVSNALGRGDGLSGRSYIWAASIAAAGNPIIGTGFESFWNVNAYKVNQSLQAAGFVDLSNLVSAHNGYLEVYLDLGLVGVGLIVLVLITGYRRAGKAFRHAPEFGCLMLVYIVTATFYSITEAGFRMLTGSWFFLLLAVVGSSGELPRLFDGEALKTLASRGGIAVRKPSGIKVIPEKATAFTTRRGLLRFEVAHEHNIR